jgi:hypothetical protein
MGRPAIDIIGQRFGLWVVVSRNNSKSRRPRFDCVCECGESRIVEGQSLRSGDSKSCGCLGAKKLRHRMTTHGMTGAPEFHSWEGMWQRCTNRNHVFFKDYGGRGITVDPRWEKFENSMKTWGRALQERHLTGKTRSTAITGRGYASGAHIENKQTRGVCVWPLLLMVSGLGLLPMLAGHIIYQNQGLRGG